MKKIKFSLITILALIFLNACTGVKEGLAGNKQKTSDEFLVDKKKPLVFPPEVLKVIEAVVNKKLDQLNLEWYSDKTLSIVLCSKGYPKAYDNKKEIKNLDKIILKENEFIFHAGTKIDESKIVSNGGRVLNFVVKSNSFRESRQSALNLIKRVDWKNGFYRKDIGFKVID